jgi:hypothetical protein
LDVVGGGEAEYSSVAFHRRWKGDQDYGDTYEYVPLIQTPITRTHQPRPVAGTKNFHRGYLPTVDIENQPS